MSAPEESESDSGTDDETMRVVYTCRKCVGVTLSKEQLDEHRDYHRSIRAKKKARAERQRKRTGSSSAAPSTTATSDLFAHKQVAKPGPKSKKKEAEKARLRRAKEKYKEGAAKTMGIRYKAA